MSETKKDSYRILIAQKTERLVAALYLVSELVDDANPIKKGMRVEAIDLLTMMNLLSQEEVKDELSIYKKSLINVANILSFLNVGLLAGNVSEMNGKLLIEGFSSLRTVLKKKTFTLDETFLGGDIESQKDETKVEKMASFLFVQDSLRSKAILPESNAMTGKEYQVEHAGHESLPVREMVKSQTAPQRSPFGVTSDGKAKMPVGVFKARKTSRRDQILALFVKGVDMSIKDVSIKVKGCSEKTIQRELNALVFDHVIERIGEKRWSRYVLR